MSIFQSLRAPRETENFQQHVYPRDVLDLVHSKLHSLQVPSGRAKVKQPKTQEELEYDELEALQAEMAL